MEKSFGKVKAEKITVALNGKKNSVQLRQTVTTTYDAAKAGNSKSDTVFSTEDFNFGKGQSFENDRVAFMDAPLSLDIKDPKTLELIQKKIDQAPNARLYRVLSLNPILTSEQKTWMMNLDTEEEREEFLNKIKERQTIINPDTAEVILFKGQVQYGATYFSATGKEDVDTREEESVTPSTELAPPSKEEVTEKAKEVKSF